MKVSLLGLGVTSALQLVVVLGSGALLADTLHNFSDALTAVPLCLAFVGGSAHGHEALHLRLRAGRGPGRPLRRRDDRTVRGHRRLLHPAPVQHLVWVAVAGLVGFAGNEMVAVYRIRVGRAIGSAALVADGLHARTDGMTSLAVLVGAGGVALGWALADPIVGLVVTLAILTCEAGYDSGVGGWGG